ncbi:MAG: ECF transporter S component [Hydrogenoanaerobacterium sp.]
MENEKQEKALEAKKGFSIYDIVAVALMAAVVYVVTNFRITIPTPIGKTMLHFGNVFCLLSAFILGGKRGGLAAGLGSMFFDLFSDWATSAPFTLVFKFIMAYVCGKIAYGGDAQAKSLKRNIVAALCGAVSYTVLYTAKNVVTGFFFMRNPWQTVLLDAAYKGGTSLVNAIIAVVAAVALAPLFRKALEHSGFYQKLYNRT